MHEIYKMVSLSADGKSRDSRLTKPDAFSGARLLRMLTGLQESDFVYRT